MPFLRQAPRAVKGLSSSSSHVRWFSVYRKGILVSDVDPPLTFEHSGILLFEPKFAINMVGSGPGVNLARNTLIGDDQDWFEPIHTAYCKKVVPIDDILSACLNDRFRLISKAITLSFIEPNDILELLPHAYIPIPYIENNGVCGFIEFRSLGNTAFVFPNIFDPLITDSFISRVFGLDMSKEDDVLRLWSGEMCILVDCFSGTRYTFAYFDIVDKLMDKYYYTTRIRFLEPPWSKRCPVVQRIVEREAGLGSDEALNSAISDSGFYLFEKLVKFDGQFSEYFKFSDLLHNFFNLHHPVVLWVIDIIMSAQAVKSQIGAYSFGQITDAIAAFFSASDEESAGKELASLTKIASIYGVLPKQELPKKYQLDFVPLVERANPFEEEIELTKRYGMLYQV